jgi:hypothetical protein
MDRTRPPPSNVAAKEARRKRAEEFKRRHGIGPASEEFKARCVDHAARVAAWAKATYHGDEK